MIQLKIISFFVLLIMVLPIWALDVLKCPVLTTERMCQEVVSGKDPKIKIEKKSKALLHGYCRGPKPQGFLDGYFKGTVLKEYGECSYAIPSQWVGTFATIMEGREEIVIYRPLPQGFFSMGRFEFSCPKLSHRDFKTLSQGYTIETKDGYVWKEKKKHSLHVGRLKFSSPIGRRGYIDGKRKRIHRMCSYNLDSSIEKPVSIVLRNIVTDEVIASPLDSDSESSGT